MAEIVAAGTLHPHDKRLALSACSHNEYGQPYSVSSNIVTGGDVTGPSVGVVVKQLPKIAADGAGPYTLKPADLGCYIYRNGAATTWILPAAADIIAYFGLKQGDLMEVPFFSGTAGLSFNVSASGLVSEGSVSPLTSAADKGSTLRLYVSTYLGGPGGAGGIIHVSIV